MGAGIQNFKLNQQRNVLDMLNTARVNSRLVQQTESQKKKYTGVRNKLMSPKQPLMVDDLIVPHSRGDHLADMQSVGKEILLADRPLSPNAHIQAFSSLSPANIVLPNMKSVRRNNLSNMSVVS